MEFLYTYAIGVAAIVGFILYEILFCYAWKKFSGDDLMDNNYGILGAMVLSFVIPLAAGLILLFPFLIGKAIISP